MATQNHHLFSLGGSIAGTPTAVNPATLRDLGALELRDLERWVKATPALMGEELFVVTSQLAENEHFRDRLDVLALDRAARLVVIELKRDNSGRSVELQALKYAARVSTMTAEEVVAAHAEWRTKEGTPTTPDEARERLAEFANEGDDTDPLAPLDDEDVPPRIILAAGSFRQDVTATVLFLRSFEMDVSCVQLSAYEVNGNFVLLSQVLIPLPEAKDYEARSAAKRHVNQRRKRRHRLSPEQRERVKEFIAAIPDGRWTSYKDVALAATGNPQGGMGIGSHLSSRFAEDYPKAYRVLNRHGEISPGWKPASPELPATPEAVRELLEREGVTFVGDRAVAQQRFEAREWIASQQASGTNKQPSP